jgi:hypothetical protein
LAPRRRHIRGRVYYRPRLENALIAGANETASLWLRHKSAIKLGAAFWR